jgi:hypothetical protein
MTKAPHRTRALANEPDFMVKTRLSLMGMRKYVRLKERLEMPPSNVSKTTLKFAERSAADLRGWLSNARYAQCADSANVMECSE